VIARIIVILLIIMAGAASIVLPKFTALPPVYSKSQPQVEAAKTTITNYPTKADNFQEAPQTTAQSVAVIDFKTGVTLYEKTPDLKHLPASITKLMTALVALQNCSPDTVVTIGDVQKDGSQMGLETGDQVTIENLIYGLLIKSGNDAAFALASACAQSSPAFVESMNGEAKSLSLLNSHFANPAGFDDALQYSTATDLARLAKVAIGNPLIAKIVATKSTVVTDVSGNKTYFLENVNQLIGEVNGVEGIKTGETDGAGENLITKTTRGNNSIITVVLGSSDRFGESKNLIEWAFANYRWTAQR
jgi:D-alanyl-D-alanine carboxypeptidase (penicillin-binding protein 5/6)